MTADLFTHKAPWQDWFVTQGAVRGVLFCKKGSDETVKVEPPTAWGRHWAWNVVEDGSEIYFRKTRAY